MFNLHLSAEQIEFRDTIRSFAANEIKAASILPARLEPFEKPLMRDLLSAVSELGLRSLTLSEENDGVGTDTLTSCIVLEELAAGDIDIAVALGQTALIGQLLFDKWATKNSIWLMPVKTHPLSQDGAITKTFMKRIVISLVQFKRAALG